MLLFDEIVFVTRSLCPENMRDCSFVRFLDEEGLAPSPERKDWSGVREVLKTDPRWAQIAERAEGTPRPRFTPTIRDLGVYWDGAVDNHTHGLRVGTLQTTGNADLPHL